MERNNKIKLQEPNLFGTDDYLQNIKEGTEDPNEDIVPVAEDKPIPTIQTETEVISVHGGDTIFGGKKKNFSPKVSLSFVDQTSAPVVPYSELESMFDQSKKIEDQDGITLDLQNHVLGIWETVPEGIINKKFKPVRLTNQELKLCYALSYLMTIKEEDPQLRLAIDETEEGKKDPMFAPLLINANEFTKLARGTTRPRDKEWTKEVFMSITQKLHVFSSKITRNGTNETFRFTFPLVVFKGFVEKEVIGNDGIRTMEIIGIRTELLRPFFDNIRKKNIPLTPQIFRLWKDSSLFANLFNELNKLWYIAYIGFKKATKDVLQEHGNIKNADKISEVEEEIHKRQYQSITRHLTFEFITSLCEEDYYSTKQKKLRFKKDIEKYLKTFVEYGIITSGKIIPEEKKIVVVFNMNFKGSTELKNIESN